MLWVKWNESLFFVVVTFFSLFCFLVYLKMWQACKPRRGGAPEGQMGGLVVKGGAFKTELGRPRDHPRWGLMLLRWPAGRNEKTKESSEELLQAGRQSHRQNQQQRSNYDYCYSGIDFITLKKPHQIESPSINRWVSRFELTFSRKYAHFKNVIHTN